MILLNKKYDVSRTFEQTGELITINNTGDLQLRTITEYGNTSQETTTGKNLIRFPYDATSGTYGNVNVTMNNDGSVTFSGTGNETAYVNIIAQGNKIHLGAGTYTLSTKNAGIEFTIRDTAGNLGYIARTQTSATFTLSEAKDVYLYFAVRNGISYNVTIYPMLESGSSATEWEKPTNGASPNPDYPQDIESITGDIKIVGKNLFDAWEIGKMISSTNGAISDSTTSAITGYIPVDFNTNPNYYISGLTDTLSSFVGAYNSNKQFLGRTPAVSSKVWPLTTSSFNSGTPQGTGDIAYIIIRQYVLSGTSTGTIDDVSSLQTQVEIGNQATSYKPYKEVEINLGKNLCEPQGYIAVAGSNYVAIGGSMTQVTSPFTTAQNYRGVGFIAKVEANKTYVISDDVTFTGSYTYFVGIYATKDKVNQTSEILERITITNNTFTPNYSGYAVISKIANASGTTITWSYIQVEVGTTPTTYSPYFTPIELCKIGDVTDTLDINLDTGVVSKVSNIGKYIANNDLTNNGAIATTIPMLTPSISALGNSVDLFSNLMLEASSGDTRLAGTTSSGKVRVYLSTNYATTMAEANTYLTNNNFTIYFPLATPTTETITTLSGEDLNKLKLIVGENIYQTLTNMGNANQKLVWQDVFDYFPFDKILASGYEINEQPNVISKKQRINGKRKKIVTNYTDVTIKIKLGCFDGDTLASYLQKLVDGEYQYYSLKDKTMKNANFIVTLPSQVVENSASDIIIDDFTATLEKSSDAL